MIAHSPVPDISTVLVVDDVAANRLTLRELLHSENYHLIEAADGPTALRMAAETPPDLVLLDVMMPGMNGFEVCRRLRADARLAEVPIIIVTALDDQASRLRGIEAGADDFITKPFNRAELRARTRSITRLNRYRRLHEAREALRETGQWLKAIFDQAAVGVVQVDTAQGHFLQFNQRFCDFLGYTREELDRLTLTDVTHKLDLATDAQLLEQLRKGVIHEYTREKRYVRKDGSFVWASVAVSELGVPGEPPTSFIGVVLDITERKRLDDHFIQAQKMEALGQFSGGVAHDFNNILAAIGGYAELSRMILEGNPEVREYLSQVLRATGRAADLVRQILTFSRQEPQVRRPLQLQLVVSESLELMRSSIPSTIAIESSIASELPNVLANANQIHQVLMNLGINAWHSMRERPGVLEVKLEAFTVTSEYAATKPRLQAGPYVRLSISDTGCGMDPETLRRIFDPFFTTKGPGDGTGLGLSVVHGIMDGHDGAVTVHSHVGEGTVFRLYFPAFEGEAAALAPEEGPVARGNGERVLIVDDEEVLASMIQKTLVSLGYHAEFTTDPKEAVRMVRADPERFEVVLSDQTMPGLTGLGLATRIKEFLPEMPIILMTGYSLSLTADRIVEAGVRELVLKPVTLQSLGRAVSSAILGRPVENHGSNSPYR
jgi:PAS domain S-box-containing protein